MARRGDAFEDRGQSMRPAKPGAGARNQGGFQNAPKEKTGPVAPPPVSRARKDSVLRPVRDGGSSSGGSIRRGDGGGQGGGGTWQKAQTRTIPPAPPVRGKGNAEGRGRGPQADIGRNTVGVGPDRQQEATADRNFGDGGVIGPPAPRNRQGVPAPTEMAPTPGSVAPEDAQVAKSVAEMPPSSPANAGARQPQSPAEMGQPMTDSGNPLPTPDAQPPQNDPEVQQGMPTPEESAKQFNSSVGAAGPDGFGGRMGEDILGFKIENSDQIANGEEWKGEIGPGMSANQSGAIGMPGQNNSPEDVAFNRQRFDSALNQSKGDKLAASLSSGSYASGNPIAHGTMTHLKRLGDSSDGDGVDPSGLDESTRRRYKADAARQMEEYGAYPGMDDPGSPAPPVRPLSWSYNPYTGKTVSPEGAESYIDRFGKGEQ